MLWLWLLFIYLFLGNYYYLFLLSNGDQFGFLVGVGINCCFGNLYLGGI